MYKIHTVLLLRCLWQLVMFPGTWCKEKTRGRKIRLKRLGKANFLKVGYIMSKTTHPKNLNAKLFHFYSTLKPDFKSSSVKYVN